MLTIKSQYFSFFPKVNLLFSFHSVQHISFPPWCALYMCTHITSWECHHLAFHNQDFSILSSDALQRMMLNIESHLPHFSLKWLLLWCHQLSISSPLDVSAVSSPFFTLHISTLYFSTKLSNFLNVSFLHYVLSISVFQSFLSFLIFSNHVLSLL